MVRAEYAGSGKTYACNFMEKLGHKVLFVCPTNKLVQNNEDSGCTLNQFFSVGMTEDETKNMKRFDDSSYDVIVFDEIYFANITMLARIKRYSENNPNKIIIATGDTCQLETIDLISSEIDYDVYSNHCIDMIFPNNIYLKENKRLKTEEDKNKLKHVKADIFNKAIPIITTLRKYFRFTNDIKTTHNIAFKNETCCSVSQTIRRLLNKQAEYEIDETLICRKYYKTKRLNSV